MCFCIYIKAQDFNLSYDFSKLNISQEYFLKLLNTIDANKLYLHKEWKNLLHYSNNQSEITNEDFFYSNKDLKNELYESLFHYFIDKKYYLNKKIKLNQENSAILFSNDNDNLHFICKYPLRALFLEKYLDIKKTQELNCSDLNNFFEYINPKSVSIVYPAAYLNSPASMFGHTFLLINSNYNSRLISYAINWAADVDEKSENAIAFAYKGLFGGYVGKYSLKPYYDMLKTYKDSENRDLYEYDLALNEDEIRRLILHLWEIKDTTSTYLFLNKNCSYNILWLLENAKPNLNLRDSFFYTIIPSNTIQKMNEKELITNYHYRASKLNTILTQANNLSHKQIKQAKEIALNKQEPNNDYLILALANELSSYYASKSEIPLEEYKNTTHKISSFLSKANINKLPKIPEKTSIIYSNYPSKIAISYDKNNNIFLNLRAAIHDIYEDDFGFDKGIAVEFFNTKVKLNKRLKLDNFTLLNLASLSDFNYINHKPSFTIKLAYDEVLDKNYFNLETLGGLTFSNNFYLLSILSGLDFYKKGISFNNKIIFQLSYKTNKLSFIYQKNFYKNNNLDIFNIKTHSKIFKNFAIFTDYKKIKHSNESYELGLAYYF